MRRSSAILYATAVTAVVLAVYNTGRLTTFIDITSLVIVVGGTALLTLVNIPLKEIIAAFGCSLRTADTDADELERAREVFVALGNHLVGFGVLGFLIGAVIILGSLDDPSQLVRDIAVATLSLVYAAALLAFVVTPMEVQIARRSRQIGGTDEHDWMPGMQRGLLLIAMASIGMLPFFVLLLVFT